MTDKKLQRLPESVKNCNNTALTFASATTYYLIVDNKTINWATQTGAILTITSILMGIIVLAGTIGAWNTRDRDRYMNRMYCFFVIQLVLLFVPVLLIGFNLKLI